MINTLKSNCSLLGTSMLSCGDFSKGNQVLLITLSSHGIVHVLLQKNHPQNPGGCCENAVYEAEKILWGQNRKENRSNKLKAYLKRRRKGISSQTNNTRRPKTFINTKNSSINLASHICKITKKKEFYALINGLKLSKKKKIYKNITQKNKIFSLKIWSFYTYIKY